MEQNVSLNSPEIISSFNQAKSNKLTKTKHDQIL
jgi:hypothetical protein